MSNLNSNEVNKASNNRADLKTFLEESLLQFHSLTPEQQKAEMKRIKESDDEIQREMRSNAAVIRRMLDNIR